MCIRDSASAALVQPSVSQIKSRPMRIYGSKKVTSPAVKTVPRRLTAFIGRLHIDTTDADLMSFLSESGLKGVKCTKLKPPTGRQFKTAASVFHVLQQTAMKNCFMMNVFGPKVSSFVIGTLKRKQLLITKRSSISNYGYQH